MLIVKYTADWVRDFGRIKYELENALQGLIFRIEHVGSTSVPNLDAKPVIDIDIVYTEVPVFEKIKSALERAGYSHKGNQGIEDRDVFKRNGAVMNRVLDTVKHHLYVCPANSKALARHILSRNYLRKNEWARVKYQEMKYDLAEKANHDRKVYAALKELYVNEFIDSITASGSDTAPILFE